MDIKFRSVNSIESVKKTIDFLTADVIKHGGSATEIVDMHGNLMQITICKVPWGALVIKKEISKFEAWGVIIQDIE